MTEENRQDAPSLSRQDFEKELVRRARADADFKQQLLADPKAAIQRTYGMEIPPDVQVEVLQETASKFYVVLPPAIDELTDEQLAAVAGGVGMPLAAKDNMVSSKMWSPSIAAGGQFTFK
jgi:hypothetical protein